MARMVDLTIAGRTYQVACREGEEDNLRAAARLVDGKSREALAGLGTLSEARQFLFASLLLADQLVDGKPEAAAAQAAPPSPPPPPPPAPAKPDPAVILRAESLADRLESVAMALENEASDH
jgi:cell division protein ZapA